MLPPAELTTINSKWTFELIENSALRFKGILAKNSDGRQTSSEFKPGWVGLVTWMVDHLQRDEKLCCAFSSGSNYFSHYHSFSLVLKHRKRVHFWNVTLSVDTRLPQLYGVSSGLVEVGDFLVWLVIFFGLVLSLKLQIELMVSYLKSRVSHWSGGKLLEPKWSETRYTRRFASRLAPWEWDQEFDPIPWRKKPLQK